MARNGSGCDRQPASANARRALWRGSLRARMGPPALEAQTSKTGRRGDPPAFLSIQ
jgi:hypothetical protein